MHTVNVLVVDDDLITLELLTLVLAEYTSGNVDSFSNSVDAISAIQEKGITEYGLIISDLVMPEKTGLDVLIAARAVNSRTPFLMLTANSTREAVLKARKLGASGFMAKPFATDDLLDKLDALLKPE